MKGQKEVKALLHTFSYNFKPKSVSIFLVTPGSRVTLLDENISKHAEPGVASIGTQARELNFLDLTLLFCTYIRIIYKIKSKTIYNIKITKNKIKQNNIT